MSLPDLPEPEGGQTHVVRMLKAVRVSREWSQADLARQLNVSRWTINRWENGNEPPTYLQAALREMLADLAATVS